MKTRAAFTLIELLVVISIIALLIGILLPALGAARDSALKVSCLSAMRQVGLGIANYQQANDDYIPPAFDSTQEDSSGGTPEWFILINSYMSDEDLTESTAWFENGEPQASRMRKSAVWGCPVWLDFYTSGSVPNAIGNPQPVYDIPGEGKDSTGYAMTLWPLAEVDNATNTVINVNAQEGDKNVRTAQNKGISILSVRQPSARVSLAEAHYGFQIEDQINYTNAADFVSADPEQFSTQYRADLDRHGSTSNHLFLDGHAESGSGEAVWSGLMGEHTR